MARKKSKDCLVPITVAAIMTFCKNGDEVFNHLLYIYLCTLDEEGLKNFILTKYDGMYGGTLNYRKENIILEDDMIVGNISKWTLGAGGNLHIVTDIDSVMTYTPECFSLELTRFKYDSYPIKHNLPSEGWRVWTCAHNRGIKTTSTLARVSYESGDDFMFYTLYLEDDGRFRIIRSIEKEHERINTQLLRTKNKETS